jgi:outer membrane lipoprotein-sorting protein
MLKTIKPVLFTVVMAVVLFSGCAIKGQPTGIEKEENAQKLKADTTFYSTYLGLELTVLQDWWIYEKDPLNITEDNSTDAEAVALNIMGDDTFSFLPLITYSNLQYSSELGHLETTVVAENVSGVWSLNEYNQQYLDYMTADNADFLPELIVTETEDINGREFITNIIRFNGAEEPFEIMTMSTEGRDGYYIQFSFTYWVDMYDDARVVAKDIIKSRVKFNDVTLPVSE